MSELPFLCGPDGNTPVFTKYNARIVTAQCSPEEVKQISSIEARRLQSLCEWVLQALGVEDATAPPVTVLCCGRHADPAGFPLFVRNVIQSTASPGAWSRRRGLIIIGLSDRMPVERILIHEMTHALFDLTAENHTYPAALHEGFACMAEYSACAGLASRPRWHLGGAPNRCLSTAQLMGVHELLSVPSRVSGNIEEMYRFVRASYWLVDYLLRLCESHPRMKRVLSELRRQGLMRADEVFEWIRLIPEWTGEELEARFRCFCTTREMVH